MPIFGHSEYVAIFLEEIVRKNLKWPFLAIPNLYQSFVGKFIGKKSGTSIFGHYKFVPVFLGKIVGKNLERPISAIPNLYQSFWEKS